MLAATGFDWDRANTLKNWEKHQVSPFECEQLFFNRPLVVHVSEGRTAEEERFYCLGKTDARRLLFLVKILLSYFIIPWLWFYRLRKKKFLPQ